MDTLVVEIRELPAMRVATLRRLGMTPDAEVELAAVQDLQAWAEAHGQSPAQYRMFGYDSCLPFPDHTYTTLLPVDDAATGDDVVQIGELIGGAYAVAEVTSVEAIAPTWEALARWCEDAGYGVDESREWLEEFDNPNAPPARLWEPISD